MAEELDFNQQLMTAINEKTISINTELMPKIQGNYRMHLSLVQNIYDALVKRSIITPDPYKKEKKISDIVCPDGADFPDNERAMVMGIRLSDYESMLDFICNYFKFNVDTMTLDKVQKLLNLNATFTWSNLSTSSSKPNTRGLGECIASAKAGGQQITISTLVDGVSKSADVIKIIDEDLKAVALFLREKYKGDVRKNVMGHPQFNKTKAYGDKGAFLAEIKRLYPTAMPHKGFSTELVGEIIQEEIGNDKDLRRQNVLKILQVQAKKVEKKTVTVDTHEMLMEAVRGLGAMSEQYNVIANKIAENHDILQSEHNTFKEKLKKFLRKTFGMPEPPIDYEVTITDKNTGSKRKEIVHYNEFLSNLIKRARYYTAISTKRTQGYNKVAAQSDDAILDFLQKQISENGRVHIVLGALDEFFKNNVSPANRPKIKGLGMELTTLKNSILNVNSHCGEYKAYKEEKEQMKKLGITNA